MTDTMATEQQSPADVYRERYPGAVILPYEDAWPEIAESAFIAPTAVVIGNVSIGEEASVWYHATVRGDIAPITIGDRSNVQDNTVVHVNMDAPIVIGKDVTLGHSAIIHGTTIGHGSMIGMGSIVMSYSHLGSHCVVAAGDGADGGRGRRSDDGCADQATVCTRRVRPKAPGRHRRPLPGRGEHAPLVR
ncbi:MAG TPA: gamma carbonic anhydrase family protein [Thermomicrobiales bacterium]|nr:gamma carbonic anhydrase family protein [Thermomicrobiales bacterium]